MITRLLDFLFPRICPICGGRLSLTEEHLCLECLMSLPRTTYSQSPDDNDVKNLFELQIPIVRAGAFMRYMPGKDSARLVGKLKYSTGKKLARFMGRMVAEEYSTARQDFFGGIDVIVPMPLSASRLRERGYNQAEEMAKGISDVTGIAVDTASTRRKHFKVSQTSLTRMEREENVKGAFECVLPERLNGKHILLLDDVITTGSTVLALADSILAKAKGVSFSVLSIGITGEMRH